MNDVEVLKGIIANTDLEQFISDESKLNYALFWAASEINLRRGFTATENEPYEPKYHTNVIEGAIYRLQTLGIEGQTSFSENGVSGDYKEIPDWLLSVVPRYYKAR